MSDVNDVNAEDERTYLVDASRLCEGDHVLLEGHVCVIVAIDESVGVDVGEVRTVIAVGLFDPQRFEVTLPVDQSVVALVVTHTEYTLLYMAEDGLSLTLAAEDGRVRDDLKLEDDTSSVASFAIGVRENFEDGRLLSIGVESAMGNERIMSMTQMTAR
ncbi:hypothetical protein [Embleya sp. NPDC020630]|uniref:hypothetical protein n=1 Tax=Embleya sp. NPDC020630 TaxID=3363979 RepID=UPI00379AAFB0